MQDAPSIRQRANIHSQIGLSDPILQKLAGTRKARRTFVPSIWSDEEFGPVLMPCRCDENSANSHLGFEWHVAQLGPKGQRQVAAFGYGGQSVDTPLHSLGQPVEQGDPAMIRRAFG